MSGDAAKQRAAREGGKNRQMRTVAEPKRSIEKLWGKQSVRENAVYRLMRYSFRVNDGEKVLLLNVVTGRLVVLDQSEAEMLNTLPWKYTPLMEQLVANHYLVPEDYDEHQQVTGLRKVLWIMDDANMRKSDVITSYTILTTTACNARCYYCFEHGVHPVTMTERTAADTVRFISDHCGNEKKVSIRWFGGEPTVAAHRIDQICQGLRDSGIAYSSSITTNGYLFDEEMAARAKSFWNVRDAMICLDGTEKNYNEIKAYVNPKDNPYQRVLRNVGLLLDQGISVSLRMNFDLGNYQDFRDVLSEAAERFHGNERLKVYAFPVEGAHPDKNGRVLHGSDAWFDEKIAELNDMARNAGLFQRTMELPSLFFTVCKAGDPSSMVISPQGELARCTSIFYDEKQIVGSVTDGVIRPDFCDPWKEFADPKRCRNCTFFPKCVLIENCPGKDRCFRKETFRQQEESVKRVFKQWNETDSLKGEMNHDHAGTEGRI